MMWQHVRCGRTEIGKKEVDTLFRGCHVHHLLRGSERVRPGTTRRKWAGKAACYNLPLSILLTVDFSQNRMAESLVLFESVINSRWFVRTSIILFLNKIDLVSGKSKSSDFV